MKLLGETMTAEQHHQPVTAPIQPLAGPPLGVRPVQVLYGRRRFRSARVCNLSALGMSLALRNLTLPAGTRVELELEGSDRPVEAVVVRHAGSETTVVFREPQLALARGSARCDGDTARQAEAPALDPPPKRPQLARR